MESGSGGSELGIEQMVSGGGERIDFIPPAIGVFQDVFPDYGNENRIYAGELEFGFNGGNVEYRLVGHRRQLVKIGSLKGFRFSPPPLLFAVQILRLHFIPFFPFFFRHDFFFRTY